MPPFSGNRLILKRLESPPPGFLRCRQGPWWLRGDRGGARDRGADMQEVGQPPDHGDQRLRPKQHASCRSGWRRGRPASAPLAGQGHHHPLAAGRVGAVCAEARPQPQHRSCRYTESRGRRSQLSPGNRSPRSGVGPGQGSVGMSWRSGQEHRAHEHKLRECPSAGCKASRRTSGLGTRHKAGPTCAVV